MACQQQVNGTPDLKGLQTLQKACPITLASNFASRSPEHPLLNSALCVAIARKSCKILRIHVERGSLWDEGPS